MTKTDAIAQFIKENGRKAQEALLERFREAIDREVPDLDPELRELRAQDAYRRYLRALGRRGGRPAGKARSHSHRTSRKAGLR
jgi:hypothetical protein